MPHIIKDFIIHLKYPLELPQLPESKRLVVKANWIEALAMLNRELRMMAAKNVILNIDYTTDGNLQLMAKRYSNDAVLQYTKNGQSWELISRNCTTLSGNVLQLARYMELVRKADKLKILSQKIPNVEMIALPEPIELEPESFEGDVFQRIQQTNLV